MSNKRKVLQFFPNAQVREIFVGSGFIYEIVNGRFRLSRSFDSESDAWQDAVIRNITAAQAA